MTSSSPAIRSAISCACAGQRRGRGRARARPPRGRCRRAGSRRRRGTPPPGRSASAPPARTARGGSRPAPRRAAATPDAAAAANGSAQSSAERTNQTPLPSYPPRVVFSTHGKPNASTSATDATTALRGHGHAELGQPRAHHALVLGVHQRLRPGAHGDAVGLERVQVLGRHVLVVEGDHRAAVGDLAQRVEVACSRRRAWSGITWAAETPSASASSRSGMPSAAAGSAIIRASWPPPMTARVGCGLGHAVSVVSGSTALSVLGLEPQPLPADRGDQPRVPAVVAELAAHPARGGRRWSSTRSRTSCSRRRASARRG